MLTEATMLEHNLNLMYEAKICVQSQRTVLTVAPLGTSGGAEGSLC